MANRIELSRRVPGHARSPKWLRWRIASLMAVGERITSARCFVKQPPLKYEQPFLKQDLIGNLNTS